MHRAEARSPSRDTRKKRRTQADRSANARAALIAAARSVLSDLGFRHATTAAIARRAEVSTGSLHHHYATKEDLLISVLDDVGATVVSELERLTDNGSGSEEFAQQAVNVLWRIYGNRQYWAVWEINIGLRSDKSFAQMLTEHRRSVRDRMHDAIAHNPNLSAPTKGVLLTELPFILSTMRGMFMETFAAQHPGQFEDQLAKLVLILARDLEQAG